MGQYQGYEQYKDSGVEWLGEIPESWEVKRVKFIGHIKYGLGEPPEQLENGLPLIRATDIYRGIIDGSKVQRVNPDKVPWSREPELKTGDILVVRSGAYTGDSAIIPDEWAGSIAGYDMVLTPTKAHSKYVAWNLLGRHVLEGQLYLAKSRAAQPHLNAEELGNTILAIPPLEEQNTIAQFLDHKTSQIDALISKKEALLEKLDEKRTALISHAVTKGLDPTVPMKDSGIQWLGKIPEHWEIKPLRYAIQHITYGFTNPMPTEEEGPFMLTANDIGDGYIKYESARRTSLNDFKKILTDKSRPQKGDILLTKDGTLGRVAVFEGQSTQLACINQSIALLRVNTKKYSIDYIQNILRSQAYQDMMIFDAGGTTIKHIYITRIVKMPVAFAPFDEQEKICAFCERQRNEIGSSIDKIKKAIDLLKEYRTALITNAVTGKIDVRQVPIPQP